MSQSPKSLSLRFASPELLAACRADPSRISFHIEEFVRSQHSSLAGLDKAAFTQRVHAEVCLVLSAPVFLAVILLVIAHPSFRALSAQPPENS